MAASFGEKLLGEVHEEGLDELLHDLRAFAAPPGHDYLGLKEIDDLLQVFMPVSSSQVEHHLPDNDDDQDMLLSRDEGEPVNEIPTHLPLPTRLAQTDPVVEISSTSSGAGKSQLLYYLTAVSILPSTYNGENLGGRNAAVVFIDADGRFDAQRLQAVARGIVREKLNKLPGAETDIEALLADSLRHVHVFRPQSSSALLATLQTLDKYLFDLPRHYSAGRPLQAIILDSTTAFFWPDKLRDEVARIEEIGRPTVEIERERDQKQRFHLSVLYAHIVKELKRLQRTFGCSVVFTTTAGGGRRRSTSVSGPFDGPHAPPPSTYRNPLPSFRSPLPRPWGTFPTLRLVVRRDAVRTFPPGMTATEAEQDAAMRHEVVAQGKFSAYVNGWGREEWPSRVVQGLQRRDGGMFSFYVRGDGLLL